MKLFNNYEAIRNLGLFVVSVILINQLIISCNSSKNFTCPTSSSNQKFKPKKFYNYQIANIKLKKGKKKSKNIPISKDNSVNYSFDSKEEYNQELELYVLSGNEIFLPAYETNENIKIEYLKPQVESNYVAIESIGEQKKGQNNSFKNKGETDNVIIQKSEFNKNNKNINTLFALFAGLFGFLTFGAFRTNLALGKRISSWAKANPRKTMLFINMAHLALISGGLYIGKNIHDLGFAVSKTSTNVLLGVGGLAVLLYPTKKTNSKFLKNNYLRRKSHDLALVLCGFLLMTNIGNRATADRNYSKPVTTVFQFMDQKPQQDASLMKNLSEPEFFKQQKEPSPIKKIGKILLTILTVALFAGLLFVLAVASCVLACSDLLILALLVAIGGPVGAIALLVIALKAIWKKKSETLTSQLNA